MRRWLVAVGVGAFALAGAVAATVGESTAGSVLGPVAAAVAVVAAAWVAYAGGGDRLGPLPAVESPVASDPPGARLNVALGSLVGRAHVELTPRGVRDALRRAATAVVSVREGVPGSVARERVDDGSWTEDAVAARYLASEWSLPESSVAERVRDALGVGGDRPVVVAARAAADAVAERAGIHGDGDAPSSSWFPPAAGLGAVPHTVSLPASAADGGGEASDGDGGEDASVGEDAGTVRRERARTGRYRGAGAFALVALGVGTFAGSPATAFAGAVAAAYVAWGGAASAPSVDLAVSRSLSTTDPDPGERVRVAVTVENVGDDALRECRVVDGVPAALSVVDGSARAHCSLASGDATSFEYVVEARRGVHAYEGALAVVTDRAGAIEERHVVHAPDELECVPPLGDATRDVPLREHTTRYAGNVDTDEGGSGLEFFGTREYRRGDPLSRVDWNRFARTGALSTVEFREERAASIVLVVDGRAAGYVAPDAGGPHALDRAVDAAGSLYDALVASGNRVGVAAVSTSECWLPPGSGRGHRERVRDLLATNPALSPVPAARNLRVTQSVDRLRRRIPDGAQVFFLTPLCDDRAATIARRFEAGGRAVTVLSPDPTLARTPSHRLARVGRRLRVTGLRGSGVRVVDWAWDEPLGVALSRTTVWGDGR
ncbi:DUF58 domain-containing protein [Halorubellus litoreus]|uniref:DUF58 domain-containing protein n=1 Tax=Halorubellus litoreus TaxID=755308 RepID=A0ABD5VEP3_9EURY